MRLFLSRILGAALTLATATTARSCRPDVQQASVTAVAELGTPPSWAENLAFRPDGNLLVTRLYEPALYHVDVTTGAVVEVYAWNGSEHLGVLGVGQTTADVFYVAVAALVDLTTGATVAGANEIYRVDMRPFMLTDDGTAVANAAVVTRVATVEAAGLFNGLAVLDKRYLLVADSIGGVVYGVDVLTGAYGVAVNDSLMSVGYAAYPQSTLGINGVKVYGDQLYWTNSAAGLLARVPINRLGQAVGPASIAVADVVPIDDFAIRGDGVAFLCQNQLNTLSVAYLDERRPVTSFAIAGSNGSTVLAGVTAAMFSPSRPKRLYLSTSGGLAAPINGTVTVSGGVSYIDTTDY
ncbi:hypothetical protein CMQ_4296 [Grosmannia clavigera kw1407]|uniref:Six-bladed beta-propeller-like protein n=1 Tax=Grosmannia clavigera (strain kw1407 / UAMH 11150) TaxID=655863 RepID=F0XTZ6_GROCL|nr:uncharacterized protein CMQ_4296 [Grosmannia clavigera kw1407]EFW98444.1 hypothetical protein CMQ_4296 [Grosmannia clavigera kw1407]